MGAKSLFGIRNTFPKGFKVQRIGITAAKDISDLAASEIPKYFREHAEVAKDLLGESYDKRFKPSSFIEEKNNGFRVGWFTRSAQYECGRQFSNLADAATDYLLSLGKTNGIAPVRATSKAIPTESFMVRIRYSPDRNSTGDAWP